MSKNETQKLLNQYKPWLFWGITVLLGLIMRWLDLDLRPVHHDESLNAIYGKYAYDNMELQFYRYNPLLHGPFLYNIQPYIYEIFGVSTWTARFPFAFLGSIFIFIPFLFRKYLKTWTLIALSSFIALSPTLIYWSRFVRHDFIVISCLILILAAGLIYQNKRAWYFVFIGLSIHICAKENIFVHLAIFFGFLLYEPIILKLSKIKQTPLAVKISRNIRKNWIHFLLALAIGIFLFCYFYSAGFRYPAGILDGLYRKSFLYWLNQHGMERIKGPFSFQLLTLAWYEFAFILIFFLQTIHFYFKRGIKPLLIFFIASGLLFSFAMTYIGQPLYSIALWRILKFKVSFDIFLFFFLIIHALFLTTVHIREKKPGLAFSGYYFIASFFTYSYLGERVPWLSMYVLIPGIVYLCLYFQEQASSFIRTPLPIKKFISPKLLFSILFALISIFQFRVAVITNFHKAGEASEYIGQVHTSKELDQIALKVKQDLLYPHDKIAKKVLVTGDATWPLTWYFQDTPGYHFHSDGKNISSFDYIFENNTNELRRKVKNTHVVKMIKLRGWWLPNFDNFSIKNFLVYLIAHIPWNREGYMNIGYAVKKSN